MVEMASFLLWLPSKAAFGCRDELDVTKLRPEKRKSIRHSLCSLAFFASKKFIRSFSEVSEHLVVVFDNQYCEIVRNVLRPFGGFTLFIYSHPCLTDSAYSVSISSSTDVES